MTLSAGLQGEDEDALLATAVQHRDAGFGTLKLKVGAGGDDVSVMRRVRAEVGADVHLRVDANQAWSAEHAVSVISAWEDARLGIEMVEQPVAMDDLDALEFVTRNVQTPILADEAVWTTRDLTEVLRRRAADMVNDLDAGLWLKGSPVTGGAAYERDVVRLPDAAGLGILALAADG